MTEPTVDPPANSRPADRQTARAFRHIVWPLAVGEILIWAAIYYVFPALLPVWERELGWSKAELSGAFTLALIVSAVLAPVAGRLIDRGHGRTVFAGGALLGAVLLALLAQVTALWQFYLVWFGLGVAMAAALYEACFVVLTRAMGDQAKKAITLVTLIAGMAGTLSFPTANALAEGFGWRTTLVVFAVVVAALAVPLIWLGSGRAEAHGATVRAAEDGAEEAAPARASGVLGTATFWLLAFAFAMIALDHGMIITHILPILTERGVHPEAAVLAASMIGPMQVAGRLAMMAVERHVSTLVVAMICFCGMGAAAALLLGAAWVPGLVVAFVIAHGACYGLSSIIRPVIVAELLGRRNFGVISGLLAVPFMGSVAVAPTVAALVWQAGGYDLVLLLALFAVGAGLLALLAAWRAARV